MNRQLGREAGGGRRRIRARPRWLWAFLFVVLAATSSVASVASVASVETVGTEETSERRYRMLISGQAAGWMVEERTVEDGMLVHRDSIRLDLARGGTAIRMELAERFVETPGHVPVSIRVTQRLGSEPITTDYVFESRNEREEIVVESAQTLERRPAPRGSWSTPGEMRKAMRRKVAAAMESGGQGDDAEPTSFRIRFLDPMVSLDPVTLEYRLESPRDAVKIDGEAVLASRWNLVQSYAPQMPSTVWLSREGELLRSEASMMGLEVVTVYTRESLDAEAPAPVDLPEVLVQTFVFPDRPIENPRSVRRGVYLLRAEGVDLGSLVPNDGVQWTEAVEDELGAGALRVTVDLGALRGSRHDDSAEPRYLAASNYVDHQHPAVRALLRQPPDRDGAEVDPARRAEELRRRVARHLREKNLGTALGSAGQAAAARAGDCTEHAVLLAALLRAEGIPSRVALGLTYTERFAGREDLFGYHMWTQAWLGRRWLDLDATLPESIPFDATHLLFGVNALDGDGIPLLTTGLEGLMGRLEIEVVETLP